jgi:hypothetical protein
MKKDIDEPCATLLLFHTRRAMSLITPNARLRWSSPSLQSSLSTFKGKLEERRYRIRSDWTIRIMSKSPSTSPRPATHEAGNDWTSDVATHVLSLGTPMPTNRREFCVNQIATLPVRRADGSLWADNGSAAPANTELLDIYYPITSLWADHR